jgi:hypothetical protein
MAEQEKVTKPSTVIAKNFCAYPFFAVKSLYFCVQ